MATEVAWVVVYLSALSNIATNMLVKSDVLELLVNKLSTSNNLPLMIPVMISTALCFFFCSVVAKVSLGICDILLWLAYINTLKSQCLCYSHWSVVSNNKGKFL